MTTDKLTFRTFPISQVLEAEFFQQPSAQNYCLHLTDEAQREKLTCPRTCDRQGLEPGPEPKMGGAHIQVQSLHSAGGVGTGGASTPRIHRILFIGAPVMGPGRRPAHSGPGPHPNGAILSIPARTALSDSFASAQAEGGHPPALGPCHSVLGGWI